MRILFSLTFVMICLLPFGRAVAGEVSSSFLDNFKFTSNEEFRASWESDEKARIMGDSVLKDFRSGADSGFKLNALCSAESMVEIDIIRYKLFSIIETEKRTGAVTDQYLFAARILEKTAAVDITGLTSIEKSLIEIVNSAPPENDTFKKKGLTGGVIPADKIALFMPGVAINTFTRSMSFKPLNSKSFTGIYHIEMIKPDRTFETAHADYYRLFLYMRDDTGDLHCNINTYIPSTHFTYLFLSFNSFIQHSKKQPLSLNPVPLKCGKRKINFIYISSVTMPGGQMERFFNTSLKSNFCHPGGLS